MDQVFSQLKIGICPEISKWQFLLILRFISRDLHIHEFNFKDFYTNLIDVTPKVFQLIFFHEYDWGLPLALA